METKAESQTSTDGTFSKIETISNVKRIINFVTYNVDQAVREEQVEKTKWSNRSDRVKATIENINADLVHLQEMRNLDNNPTPEQWLSSFNRKYKSIISYRNPSKYSFGQATMYNSNTLFPIEVITRWLSDTPEKPSDTWKDQKGQTGFGSNALFIKFAFVENEKIVSNCEPFWSINIHFPLDEEVKTKCCHKLCELIKTICGNDRIILSGDFNFFFDNNRQGAKHLDMMEKELENTSKKMFTSQENRQIFGTFIGYPHDAFCAKDTKNPNSCLDYIFTKKNSNISFSYVTVCTKTFIETQGFAKSEDNQNREPEELTEPYSLPSDHLALVQEFIF